MSNQLILVDKNDEIVGYEEKMKIHKEGLLHRAFSVFIFDREKRKMLIQKRALNKYHSGGLWSNACCSHPYKDESWETALQRCMHDELGITPPFRKQFIEKIDPLEYPSCINIDRIQLAGDFQYYANLSGQIENEIDYVFLYHPNANLIDSMQVNLDEIAEIKWISLEELDAWTKEKTEEFTAWFNEAYKIAKFGIEYEDCWLEWNRYGFCIEMDE